MVETLEAVSDPICVPGDMISTGRWRRQCNDFLSLSGFCVKLCLHHSRYCFLYAKIERNFVELPTSSREKYGLVSKYFPGTSYGTFYKKKKTFRRQENLCKRCSLHQCGAIKLWKVPNSYDVIDREPIRIINLSRSRLLTKKSTISSLIHEDSH